MSPTALRVGLSLIELLIVVTIISALTGMCVPYFQSNLSECRTSFYKSVLQDVHYETPITAGHQAHRASEENGFHRVHEAPVSTFSIDVDTASYSIARRFLLDGLVPPTEVLRTEEMINYFPFEYNTPADDSPLEGSLEVSSCPWSSNDRLLRIGLKARVPTDDRPPSNLVLLIDVSGSMNSPRKLPLLKKSARLLVEHLRPHDKIAIVVYAGESRTALSTTRGTEKSVILAALEALKPGGSTNGEGGIHAAYSLASDAFIKDGINRVVLMTDGDFNLGITGREQLVNLITAKALTGVSLTVLGFGMGDLRDDRLELLADKGNGNYAYLDSVDEARKVLVTQLGGTLETVAKDVKIQVQFNPESVEQYRLIGYENRHLDTKDFVDDKKDAGELGAGHSVTALYQVVLKNGWQKGTIRSGDLQSTGHSLGCLRLRYKRPQAISSSLKKYPITDRGEQFEDASTDFKFACAVAEFGMLLRKSPHKGSASLDSVMHLAKAGTGKDPGGLRREFALLVQRAATMMR